MARKKAEVERVLQELELARQWVDQEIETLRRQAQLEEVRAEEDKRKKDVRFQGQAARTERRLGLRKTQWDIDNDLSEGYLTTQLIARLPEIAAMLPKPQELRTVQISADGQGGTTNSLLGFVARALSLADVVLKRGNHTGARQP